MGLYSGDNAVVLRKGLNTTFAKWVESYSNLNKQLTPIYSLITSDSDRVDYGVWGQMPQMREWKGSRVHNSFRDFNFTVYNKDWELTLEVDVNTYEDDTYGMIEMKLKQMMRAIEVNDLTQTVNLLVNGTTAVNYEDGNPFFYATHNIGLSGNQSNLLSGTGTSLAAIEADFVAARQTMATYKGDKGTPLNDAPPTDLYVICHPLLQYRFEQLQQVNLISNTSNILAGKFNIISMPGLTDTNDWYLVDASGIFKPFIKQTRQSPKFVSLDKPDSEQVFNHKKALYGIDYRMNFAYGRWQQCVKTTN